jgi:hypothetical protein
MSPEPRSRSGASDDATIARERRSAIVAVGGIEMAMNSPFEVIRDSRSKSHTGRIDEKQNRHRPDPGNITPSLAERCATAASNKKIIRRAEERKVRLALTYVAETFSARALPANRISPLRAGRSSACREFCHEMG